MPRARLSLLPGFVARHEGRSPLAAFRTAQLTAHGFKWQVAELHDERPQIE
jgi:hypothetical protein